MWNGSFVIEGYMASNKIKIDPEEEAKDFIQSSVPSKQDTMEGRHELTSSIVSLLVEFRDKLPPASLTYSKALTSIIVSLNTYMRYESNHIGIWNGYEHLCMAYTQYAHLMFCTQPKSKKRDSKIRGDLHNFLLEIRNLWGILISQYLDYNSKH